MNIEVPHIPLEKEGVLERLLAPVIVSNPFKVLTRLTANAEVPVVAMVPDDSMVRPCVNVRKTQPGMNASFYTLRDVTWHGLNGILRTIPVVGDCLGRSGRSVWQWPHPVLALTFIKCLVCSVAYWGLQMWPAAVVQLGCIHLDPAPDATGSTATPRSASSSETC